ncbi:MAG: 4-alpha-glucanotransferase [Gammaproteobacteria bacterium]
MPPHHGRRAGICLHITSLPGPNGIGTLGANARWFVDRLADCGMSVWQVLPIGPTGYGDSPYQLLSVFAGNPMLIDLPTLVADGYLAPSDLAQFPTTATDHVEFGALFEIRTRLCEKAARTFHQTASVAERSAYVEFVQQHNALWLDAFARYQVIKAAHGQQPWYQWPEPLRDASSEACTAYIAERADGLRTQKIIQFLFFRQWHALQEYANTRGVKLMGDLPIYVAHDSADTWGRRDLFQFQDNGQLAAVGGVPPDYFSADGQLWGNPLYDWPAHERDGFDWWIKRLRHACALTDWVRIDHFRGFEAYWSVSPDAATARDGHWAEGPGDRLFNALREAIPALPVIAEDLGVITDEVTALRQRFALPGMAVLQFLLDEPDFAPEHIAQDRVCYTGTHDNDTTTSWFAGGNESEPHAETLARQQRVLAITNGAADTVAIDLVAVAMNSPAQMAIVPMQDCLGLPSAARFNIPGTTDGNWRWRLQTAQFDDALVDVLRTMIEHGERRVVM